MPQVFRSTLLSLRDLLVSAGPLALLAVGLLAAAYWWLNPTPPRYVVLATGAEQSAYAEFGQRYQKALAAQGIEVRLLPSEGSLANLQLLREGRADLAFVQGGTAVLEVEDHEQLRSLGSLFVEPLWLFYRTQAVRRSTPAGRLDALPQLRGLRVNVGTEGSGVPILMDKLLDANHMQASDLRLSRLEQTPATVAFLDGKIDVLVFASAPESPMVQMLLQTPGVRLMDFPQNEAYGRRFPFLTPVTLPRGVVDLAGNVPANDVRLVASTNTRHSELEIAPEADRAINEPVPLLQRYLPFWLANLIQRMWLVLGILIAVMLPLSRIVPPLYQLRVRSRVFRWYGRLREIENDMTSGQVPSTDLAQALDALEAQVLKVSVPLAYADELYALRNHIQMVRGRLAR